MKIQLLIIILLISCSGRKQVTKHYDAGFKIIRTIDTSRVYKPGTNNTDYLHYRPLDIDIWYPANNLPSDSFLSFRDILSLLEMRANYYTASNAGNGVTSQVAQYLCTGQKCSDTLGLLNFKTQSVKNAIPAAGTFPLVIYTCAYNGMSYENYTLFEKLASDGFVVACINSIGRYPGDMTMNIGDLYEQVNDGYSSLGKLKRCPNIDFSKIGIVGYSWGGLAGALLAKRVNSIACLVSLDGSEFHHYGKAMEENNEFNEIRKSPEFMKMRLSTNYLRLQSSIPTTGDEDDSIYDFKEKLTGKRTIITIDSAQHEDFSCLPGIVNRSGNCKSTHFYTTISNLTIQFLEQNLKR